MSWGIVGSVFSGTKFTVLEIWLDSAHADRLNNEDLIRIYLGVDIGVSDYDLICPGGLKIPGPASWVISWENSLLLSQFSMI